MVRVATPTFSGSPEILSSCPRLMTEMLELMLEQLDVFVERAEHCHQQFSLLDLHYLFYGYTLLCLISN